MKLNKSKLKEMIREAILEKKNLLTEKSALRNYRSGLRDLWKKRKEPGFNYRKELSAFKKSNPKGAKAYKTYKTNKRTAKQFKQYATKKLGLKPDSTAYNTLMKHVGGGKDYKSMRGLMSGKTQRGKAALASMTSGKAEQGLGAIGKLGQQVAKTQANKNVSDSDYLRNTMGKDPKTMQNFINKNKAANAQRDASSLTDSAAATTAKYQQQQKDASWQKGVHDKYNKAMQGASTTPVKSSGDISMKPGKLSGQQFTRTRGTMAKGDIAGGNFGSAPDYTKKTKPGQTKPAPISGPSPTSVLGAKKKTPVEKIAMPKKTHSMGSDYEGMSRTGNTMKRWGMKGATASGKDEGPQKAINQYHKDKAAAEKPGASKFFPSSE